MINLSDGVIARAINVRSLNILTGYESSVRVYCCLRYQSDKVKSAMADLKADTGKLGAPKVQGSDLYFGSTKVDNSIVDAVVKKDGGSASLFVKTGDQFVRVATTLKKADGSSAVGTSMDAKNPALAKLNSGEAFYGDAPVLGKTYDTGYEPIKDASGVIGAYYVGYPK